MDTIEQIQNELSILIWLIRISAKYGQDRKEIETNLCILKLKSILPQSTQTKKLEMKKKKMIKTNRHNEHGHFICRQERKPVKR